MFEPFRIPESKSEFVNVLKNAGISFKDASLLHPLELAQFQDMVYAAIDGDKKFKPEMHILFHKISVREFEREFVMPEVATIDALFDSLDFIINVDDALEDNFGLMEMLKQTVFDAINNKKDMMSKICRILNYIKFQYPI